MSYRKQRNKSVAFSLHSKLNFKIIMIGDQATGKSALIEQYVKGQYSSTYKITTGVQFYSKVVPFGNEQITMQIWDTAGQQSFRSIVQSFLKLSSCALIIYSNPNQMQEKIKGWIQLINEYASPATRICLVRTKIDDIPLLQQQKQKAMKLVQDYNMDLFAQTSALQNQNVKELFCDIAGKLFEQYCVNEQFREMVQPTKDSFLISKKNVNNSQKKQKCCS